MQMLPCGARMSSQLLLWYGMKGLVTSPPNIGESPDAMPMPGTCGLSTHLLTTSCCFRPVQQYPDKGSQHHIAPRPIALPAAEVHHRGGNQSLQTPPALVHSIMANPVSFPSLCNSPTLYTSSLETAQATNNWHSNPSGTYGESARAAAHREEDQPEAAREQAAELHQDANVQQVLVVAQHASQVQVSPTIHHLALFAVCGGCRRHDVQLCKVAGMGGYAAQLGGC